MFFLSKAYITANTSIPISVLGYILLPNTMSLLTSFPHFSYVGAFKFHLNTNELSIVENKQYSIKNFVHMTSSNLCVSEVSFHDQKEGVSEALDNYHGGQHS